MNFIIAKNYRRGAVQSETLDLKMGAVPEQVL